MNTKKIKLDADSILKQINYHNNLYYNLDSPEISDAKYDELVSKLRVLKEEQTIVYEIKEEKDKLQAINIKKK